MLRLGRLAALPLGLLLLACSAPPGMRDPASVPRPAPKQPFDFTGALRAVAGQADRVVIRLDRFEQPPPRLLVDLRDWEAAQFVAAFQIPAQAPGGWCKCLGEQKVEFYRGTERVAWLSLHHDFTSARWLTGEAGWPSDAELPPETRRYLHGLLDGK